MSNIGAVYNSISQPQEALNYYNQALPIMRSVGDRAREAATLSNIGAVYRDTKQPTTAIENWGAIRQNYLRNAEWFTARKSPKVFRS